MSSARCVSDLGPVLGWADDALVGVGGRALRRAREGALDVVDAADRARVAARLAGGAIDREIRPGGFARRLVRHQRADPAVCHPAGQGECARPVRADPDLDRVRGQGAGVDARELVVAAVEAETAALAAPHRPHDGDRLLERLEALRRCQGRSAHRVRRVEVAAGADAELEAPPLSRSSVAAALASTAGGRAAGCRRRRRPAPPSSGRGWSPAATACRGGAAGRDGPGRRAGRSRGCRPGARSRVRPAGQPASGTRK